MNRTLRRKIVTYFLVLAAWYMHMHSAEPPLHPHDHVITVDRSNKANFPITALSNQGALDFAKGYASPQTPNTYATDLPSGFRKNTHTSPLNFESHTNTMRISGSTDPLSLIYLVRDSPKILTGLFHYIFDTTGNYRRQKEAHVIEEYLYMVDQDRALIYREHTVQEAITHDLIYLEEHIQELSIATYTMTTPHGCYAVYCRLEETLRDAHKKLLQQYPRSHTAQVEAELRNAHHALRYVKKTKFKDKKFKKETIAQYTDRVRRAERNLHQLHEEKTQKYAVAQRIREAQAVFNKDLPALFAYCIEQQEIVRNLYDENPAWYKRLIARQEALDATRQFYTTEISYTLSEKALADLNLYDLDAAYVQNLTGNDYQLQLQQELVYIIEASTEARFTHAPYQKIMLTCSVSAAAYNQAGESFNATRIADFCWTFLDYGSAAIEGVGIGLCSALLHIATHPVETTLYAVAGPYMLAYQLTTTLYSVLDIGITHIYDPESAHQKWDEFVQPVTDIYASLADKERATREKIKMGAALATGFYAQMKLIGGLQKLCNGALQEIASWAKCKMHKKPHAVLANSEGLVFKQSSTNSINQTSPKSSVLTVFEESFEYATTNRKLEHFFNKELHNFKPLLEALNNDQKLLVQKVLQALYENKNLPKAGEFRDVCININGYEIFTRGFVDNGIIKIGTMFIPKVNI
jgi:hypothetical protein